MVIIDVIKSILRKTNTVSVCHSVIRAMVTMRDNRKQCSYYFGVQFVGELEKRKFSIYFFSGTDSNITRGNSSQNEFHI